MASYEKANIVKTIFSPYYWLRNSFPRLLYLSVSAENVTPGLIKESEFGILGCSWEGDDIADVCHAGYEQDQALKSESESGMGRGSEPAGIEVPPDVFLRNMHFAAAFRQFFKIFFALGTAYDFAYPGKEHIHGPHCFPITVLLHVKSLDLPGVISQNHGPAEMLLDKVPLMLTL